LREYRLLSEQIVHWDGAFWRKSQFFMAIEAVTLGFVIDRLSREFIGTKPIDHELFLMLGALVLFNFYISYAWFRTNRTNREYLNVRFDRAFEIENDLELDGVLGLYKLQRQRLAEPRYVAHSSSRWEIHLPSIFMVAWSATLMWVSVDSAEWQLWLISATVILGLFICIFIIEKTGWLNQPRDSIS
jgi:hypothetical protein